MNFGGIGKMLFMVDDGGGGKVEKMASRLGVGG